MSEVPYVALIGPDWADRKHDICLYDPATETIEFDVIGAAPEAIDAWAQGLRKRYGGQAIALEQKREPLIYALCQYEFFVLYPLNSQSVCDYRRAFAPSRAKSDPTDAYLLMELLVKHPENLQAWQPGSVLMRMLHQLVENRRMLVGEKVRLTNRITDALKHYYPQVLEWFEDKDTHVFCTFLARYPCLSAAQAAATEELEQFFKSHHVVQSKTIQHATHQHRLVDENLDAQTIAAMKVKALIEPICALVIIAIAMFAPAWSDLAWLLFPLVYFTLRKLLATPQESNQATHSSQ